MSSRPLTRILPLLLLVLLAAPIASAEKIRDIQPRGYVTDLAGAISLDSKARLEALSTELESKTGAQMAIVTVHSFEGESVEEYAVDLFKHLGVGSKNSNRGVLLLLSPDERKYRIEVGYGLEPVINDARAGDAGRAMVSFLRQGDYSRAVETAAWQLARYIADDSGVTLSAQPPARAIRTRDDDSHRYASWIAIGILLVLYLLFFRGSPGKNGRRGRRGSLWAVPIIGGWGGGGWSGGGFGGSSGGFSGGGFGGFGGGGSGGGGASGGW